MNRENLAIYLNDHLAGSVAALELLEHLVAATKNSAHEAFFRSLNQDVAADQDVLRSLLEKLPASESITRKAGAWLVEKVARVKLRMDAPAGSVMERVEALEALLLGITGKAALWRALAASREKFADVDFDELAQRAEQQIETVEAKRIEAAREAFGKNG